jgi:hypothetical protein
MFILLFRQASFFFRCSSPWTSLLETVGRVIFVCSDIWIVFRQTADPDSRISPCWAHNWTLRLSCLVSFAQSTISVKSLIVCLMRIQWKSWQSGTVEFGRKTRMNHPKFRDWPLRSNFLSDRGIEMHSKKWYRDTGWSKCGQKVKVSRCASKRSKRKTKQIKPFWN